MAAQVPENFMDLIREPAFANLATLMKDGSPQVTPVWFDFDGVHVRINSAKGRIKDQNMRNHPRVALAIMDPRNPYRYMQIRGAVTEITEQVAEEHIDALAKKYLKVDRYPHRSANEVRVMYKITPERISTMG